jgi:hypothetical protein
MVIEPTDGQHPTQELHLSHVSSEIQSSFIVINICHLVSQTIECGRKRMRGLTGTHKRWKRPWNGPGLLRRASGKLLKFGFLYGSKIHNQTAEVKVWICGQMSSCTLDTSVIRAGYIVSLVQKMLYVRYGSDSAFWLPRRGINTESRNISAHFHFLSLA